MLSTFISAAILGGALYAIARHDADISIPKVILIAFGVSVFTTLGINTIGLIALPLVLLALGWALVRFCYISVVQSAIVCGIWLVAQVGLGVLFAILFSG